MQIKGLFAIVTGGSSGLGAATKQKTAAPGSHHAPHLIVAAQPIH
ncbi:MAG: hypothetical protein VCE74_07345 [Alphaproteobacteria bacterium]|jgi:NAD(P)-dependent dehydrogenase (short-subunit alcohol dehydrogenase family)